MKAPKSLFDRPGRAAAVVGAVVAVSATTAVALLSGTATATPNAGQAGKCTKNVNVRSEPDTTSQIVALCEEGTAVQVGEARDGFLRLTNLGGWAAQEYVSVAGRTPASSERATPEGRDEDDEENRRPGRAADDSRESSRSGQHRSGAHGADTRESGANKPDDSAESTDSAEPDEADSDESEAPERPAPGPAGGGLGGLLG